jgi:acid stress chaperone HdeB
MFSAWMSGWYNHKLGYATVGLGDYARNIASIKEWCTSFPGQTIMSGLDRSRPQPAPPGGQIKIDMSLMTCKQFLSSDAERQQMIAAWMSGYFHASTGLAVLDFNRFARNRKAVANYCKKAGGETLMSAIQKNAK